MGTDTMEGLIAARRYYGADIAGFSIPAAEHSTMTSWGRAREEAAYANMLDAFDAFDRDGKVVAVVSDSYDLDAALTGIWGGTLRDKVLSREGTLVVRPDSGDPVETPVRTVNAKGYRVLDRHVRVIQGDGINPNSIRAILERATSAGYATDNLAFGMGGALLQQLNRDTQKFALKCSAARINGHWIDVYKDPITDKGKQSKRGRMTLLRHREYGTFQTVPVPATADSLADAEKPLGFDDAMVTVWENGRLVHDWTFAEVRTRANDARL